MDYAPTTCDKRVAQTMMNYLSDDGEFGNLQVEALVLVGRQMRL